MEVNSALYRETISLLTNLAIKHVIHEFDSGCRMVDIWKKDKLYVVQFEPDLVGLSEIGESLEFVLDTIPDEKFYNAEEFLARLKMIVID